MTYIKILFALFISILVLSCANRAAGPTGGLKDTIPPVILKSIPLEGIVNFKKKEIQVFFNENISVEKITDNLVISPPQKIQPIVKGNGKLLTISFQDELVDSTTYTLLFGDAIVDLNEKNPIKNFSFSFATGPEIDTLQISGKLINSEDLSPIQGVLVGIHSNLNDSAIAKLQFDRIAKSDDEGLFTIRNIKAGKYKLYGLKDLSRDFIHQPGEEVAFLDAIIIPTVTMNQQVDTLWKDSITIDTIQFSRQVTYLPDNLTLKLFKEDKKRQYLVKSERQSSKFFSLLFNARQDTLPAIKPLNFDANARLLVQASQHNDSLIYWIPDSTVYKLDTLMVELKYLKTDTLNQLVPFTDTLRLSMRKLKISPKAKVTTPVLLPLNFTTTINGSFDLYNPIDFDFEEPLDSILLSHVNLYQKVDSTLKPLKYKWIMKDSIRRTFSLQYPWKPEESYELQIDSAAFHSIYGRVSNEQKSPFKIKSLDEYSALKINLENFDSLAVIQVIDPSEKVLRSAAAIKKGTRFEYLKPGDFYVRLFIDENSNGRWDTGDIGIRKQPERVYYFKKKLTLRANWELEESWDHLNAAMINQKPTDLTKSDVKK